MKKLMVAGAIASVFSINIQPIQGMNSQTMVSFHESDENISDTANIRNDLRLMISHVESLPEDKVEFDEGNLQNVLEMLVEAEKLLDIYEKDQEKTDLLTEIGKKIGRVREIILNIMH